MKPEQTGQAEQAEQADKTRSVSLEELPGLLWGELQDRHGKAFRVPHLYALVDMGRIQGELRKEVADKLENFGYMHLLDDPKYAQLKWHSAQLVSGLKSDDAALLQEWGGCDGRIVSAWIVSKMSMPDLARHLRRAAFAYDKNNARYVLCYYDPLVTPILHRLADRDWVNWLFMPMDSWWYPVSTPMGETWSRIEGGGGSIPFQPEKPLVYSDELWEALVSDAFPYQILDSVEKEHPTFFQGIDCYGVRLAKVEALLEAGRSQGLDVRDDLFAYVLGLLDEPARAGEPRWQAAVQEATAGGALLRTYFTDREKQANEESIK